MTSFLKAMLPTGSTASQEHPRSGTLGMLIQTTVGCKSLSWTMEFKMEEDLDCVGKTTHTLKLMIIHDEEFSIKSSSQEHIKISAQLPHTAQKSKGDSSTT